MNQRFLRSLIIFFVVNVMTAGVLPVAAETNGYHTQPYEMIIQDGHNSNVHTLCYSPDGKLILSAAYNSEKILLHSSDGKLLRTYKGFRGGLAFSSDGKSFWFSAAEGKLKKMGLSGNLLKTIKTGMKQPAYLAVSPDGRVAFCDYYKKGNIMVVSKTGTPLINIDTEPYTLTSPLKFTPDGKYLAAAGDFRGKIVFWNLKGKVVKTIQTHDNKAWVFDFSPDGRYLATAAPQSRISLWSVSTGKKIRTFGRLDNRKTPLWDTVQSIDFSPDGKYLISGTDNGHIRLWNTNGIFIRYLANHSSKMVRFNPDGNTMITDGPDNVINLYDISGNLLNTFKGINTFCEQVIPLSKSKLLTAGYDDRIRIWSKDGRVETLFGDDTRHLSAVAVDPRGRYVAGTPYNKGKIVFWDMKGTYKGRIRLKNKEQVGGLAFSPDGKTIASVAWDKRVNLWTLSGKHLFRSDELQDWGSTLAFSPDGNYLAAGSGYGSGKNLMIVKTASKHTQFIKVPGGINHISFSPDGTRFVTGGSDDMDLTLWDITGNKIRTFPAQKTLATAFSPDGRLIASGGYDETVRVWDINGRLIQALKGHTEFIEDLAFSNDGRILISGGDDASMRFWNTNTWEQVVFTARNDDWAMFSPDGYFDSSQTGGALVAMVKGYTAYGVDQFAAHNNRPDILLERMGYDDIKHINHFRSLYIKRLKRMNITESIPSDHHAPEANIIRTETKGDKTAISFSLSDARFKILTYNIHVNDTPVFGAAGKPVNKTSYRGKATVPLTTGSNKIEISCLNSTGAESYRAITFIEYAPEKKGDLYYIGFGVSTYKDPSLTLKYAAKDATDLADLFRSMKGDHYTQVHIKTVLNQDVTPEAIQSARRFVEKSKPEDTFVLFIAGHGIYSQGENPVYYYLTSNTDMNSLKTTAAPFRDIEYLLQGVPPRNKLFLMDTCQSGEIDPDLLKTYTTLSNKRGITARAPRGLKLKSAKAQTRPWLQQKNRYIQNDLIRRSGAIVFSSSRGNEFSYENDTFENGLFTEGVIRCLSNRDNNKSNIVTTEALRKSVATFVSKETGGLQNPVVDRDNIYQRFGFPKIH